MIRHAFAVTLLGVAFTVVGAPPAAAEDAADFLSPLENPALDLAGFTAAAGDAASKAMESGIVATAGTLSFCARRDAPTLQVEAERLRESRDAAVAALTKAGVEPASAMAPLLVIRVSVPGALPLVVDLGSVIAVRDGGGSRRFAVPAADAGKGDTLPLLRDVLTNVKRLADASVAARATAAGGIQPLERVLASKVAGRVAGFDGAPAWFQDGFLAWLEEEMRTSGEAAAAAARPVHVRALPAGAPAQAAAVVLATPLSGSWGPARSRLVRRFATEGKLAAVIAAFRVGEADVTRAAGGAPAALAAEVVASLGAPNCDAMGTVPCPLCTGKPLEVACENCDGTRALGCTACNGTSDCWAGNCMNGMQEYVGGKKVRCKFCSGGKTKCMACAQRGSVPCKPCAGSGRRKIACPACSGGRIACPDCPTDAAGRCGGCGGEGGRPCVLSVAPAKGIPCTACHGSGSPGCKSCYGTLRRLCGDCEGTGESRMVYADGTVASASKCDGCGGRGLSNCSCQGGKTKCADCDGSGVLAHTLAKCGLCDALGRHPCTSCGKPSVQAAPADPALDRSMFDAAVAFLLASREHGTDGFAMREPSDTATAGHPKKTTLFATASALWALGAVGVESTDPRLARAWPVLRRQVDGCLAGGARDVNTPQSLAFSLRALLLVGDPADARRVQALVDLLFKCQRADGFWDDEIDRTSPGRAGEGSELTTLIVVEALRVAADRKIPYSVTPLRKTLATAMASLDASGPNTMKSGTLSAQEVASKVALVVLAKAATLGEARRSFDFTSIEQVRAGLAWLDRYGETDCHPWYTGGGRARHMDGQAYFAWLFSLQRLAMLLRVDEVGGENWHRAGLAHLRRIQRADGSFEERGRFAANDSFWSTLSAIMFLARATTPITADGAK